jgi:hypothetical protein
MTPTTLRDDIVAAFADSSYPGDDRLTVYDAAGREYDETFQLLRGRDWREMPVVEFIQGDTPIPDLTPESFHYYMPALVLASLDDTVDLNSDIADSLAFFLSPSSARNTTGEFPYDCTEEYNDRMSRFSEDQRAVIIRVLEEYVARGWEDEEDVRQTIEFLRGSDP